MTKVDTLDARKKDYMKFLAILALSSTLCMAASNARETRLVEAVRKGNVPLVKHLMHGLERDGLTTAVQSGLVDNFISFADKVVQDEESRAAICSKDRELGKIIGGALCVLLGYFVGATLTEDTPDLPELEALRFMGYNGESMYAGATSHVPPRVMGFPTIYNNWKGKRPQEMKDYYYALFGSTLSAIGLGMIYDGVCGLVQTKRVSDACEIRDNLIAHREELG